MSGTSIASCLTVAREVGHLEAFEHDELLAELTELRRKAWNWDEARAIKDAGLGEQIFGSTAMRKTGRELLIFVAGDGDAEWETKAHQGSAPTPTVTGESGGGQ